MVMNPSFIVRGAAFFTKMKGNDPTRSVMMKLIRRGVNAESNPFTTDTMMDMNMKRALTRSAFPTFVDMDLTFILKQLNPFLQLNILFHELGDSGIDVRKLVISFKTS